MVGKKEMHMLLRSQFIVAVIAVLSGSMVYCAESTERKPANRWSIIESENFTLYYGKDFADDAQKVKACLNEGKDAVRLWQSNKNMKVEVKSIIVATGIIDAKPPAGVHGYDVADNVITYTQFERLMNAGGPTEGHIIRPSDGKPAKKIAWIQCAGRGLDHGTPYCSKVCCMKTSLVSVAAVMP